MKKQIQTTVHRFFVFLAALLLCVISVISGQASAFFVSADVKDYSGVLDDLKKDESFSESNYPVAADDYSLQVIQIAESLDKELFVYVYQPSGKTNDLKATSINISTAINENLFFLNYRLTFIDSDGVFYKYRVNDFTVKNDTVRYYSISNILRKWDKNIDDPTEFGNTKDEVPYGVAQLWTACTLNGVVSYAMVADTVFTVTVKTVGFIRYPDGFEYFTGGACDSHYVAFSGDYKIDSLYEAELSFVTQSVHYYLNSATIVDPDSSSFSPYTYGEKVEHNGVTVKYDDYVNKETGAGIFKKSYNWGRIEKTADFKKNESLSETAETALTGTDWVLRFYETDFDDDSVTLPVRVDDYYYTKVSEVMILKLKFETDGVTYNLGVVDNKQTGSNIPSNILGGGCEEFNPKVILGVLLLILLLILLAPFLPTIISALLWVIMLPFKLIAAIFKVIGKLFEKKK